MAGEGSAAHFHRHYRPSKEVSRMNPHNRKVADRYRWGLALSIFIVMGVGVAIGEHDPAEAQQPPSPIFPYQANSSTTPDELLIGFARQVPANVRRAAHASAGTDLVGEIPQLSVDRVRVRPGAD